MRREDEVADDRDVGGEIAGMQTEELSSPDGEKQGEREMERGGREKGLSRGLSKTSTQWPRRMSLLSTRSEGADTLASVKTWGSIAAPTSWVLRWNSRKRNSGR